MDAHRTTRRSIFVGFTGKAPRKAAKGRKPQVCAWNTWDASGPRACRKNCFPSMGAAPVVGWASRDPRLRRSRLGTEMFHALGTRPSKLPIKMGYHRIILGVKPIFKGILRVQVGCNQVFKAPEGPCSGPWMFLGCFLRESGRPQTIVVNWGTWGWFSCRHGTL